MKPKLQDIVERLAAKLAQINGESPYYTRIGESVVRGRRDWSEQEAPFCAISLETATPEEVDTTSPERVLVNAVLVIHARAAYGDQIPETVAINMLADIQTAIEQGDRTLSFLLSEQMQWASDEILYPESHQPVIAAQVRYSIPYFRHWGNPNSPLE